MSYNLNDNVNDSFEFEVSGHKYKMTYPLMEDIERLQNMVGELQKSEDESQNEEIQKWVYNFISPVDESSPSIEETMKKQNVKVVANFTNMFKTEFGLK